MSAISPKLNSALVIFMSVVSLAQSVELVVARDNRSFWAQSVATNGTMLSFVSNDSGKGANIPLQEIDVIVPGVERGKKYSDDEVDAALRIVLETGVRHGSLLKQLKILQNEWEGMRTTSGSEIEQAIAGAEASFKTNRNGAAYSAAMLSLSMGRCKDVSGAHSSQFDNAVNNIQEEYLGVSIKKIETAANATNMTADEFVRIKTPVVTALKKEMAAEDRKVLLTAIDKARATTVDRGLANASSIFAADKSVNNYLKGRTILVQLKKDVAETAAEKVVVGKALSGLVADFRSAHPEYELGGNGCPLSRKDRDMLAVPQACSSTQLIFGTPVDESCLIIVNEAPKPVPMGSQAVIPMTLVFNCQVQNSKEYCMVVSGVGGVESVKHREKLPDLFARDGHVDLLFPLDLSSRQEVKPLRDGGGAYVLLYLACRPFHNDKKNEDTGWKAISMACRIPVSD